MIYQYLIVGYGAAVLIIGVILRREKYTLLEWAFSPIIFICVALGYGLLRVLDFLFAVNLWRLYYFKRSETQYIIANGGYKYLQSIKTSNPFKRAAVNKLLKLNQANVTKS